MYPDARQYLLNIKELIRNLSLKTLRLISSGAQTVSISVLNGAPETINL